MARIGIADVGVDYRAISGKRPPKPLGRPSRNDGARIGAGNNECLHNRTSRLMRANIAASKIS